MDIGDIGPRKGPTVAILAVALALLATSAAEASCGGANRVDPGDAECLSAWWKNRGLLRKSPYHARNLCSEYGKVVAKVDLVSASDRTLHLGDDLPRDGDTRHRIRGISCCADMGICNRSDVVTDENCLARFLQESAAAGNCRHDTASATAAISGENYNCNVTAECEFIRFDRVREYRRTSITIPWLDLGDVNNCDGVLTHGMCGASQVWLSVSNALAEEAEGASLDFTVTLNQPFPETLTVSYATQELTGHSAATAGLDYTATSGTLAFAPGQTSQTVSVPVLDDDLDESTEVLQLTLSNPAPFWANLWNSVAWGTIANTDRMPKAWIARFGRTVADQVLDAVDARLRAMPEPGVEARLAGQRIVLDPPFKPGPDGNPAIREAWTREREAGVPRAPTELAGWPNGGAKQAAPGAGKRPNSPVYGRAVRESDLLPGTSFALTAETGGRGLVSVWGRGAVTQFSGQEPAAEEAGGDLSVDGKVASGLMGADWTRGRWTTGLVVSHSSGDGGYRGATRGRVTAALNGVWPWMRLALGEGLSVWGIAGHGDGSVTLNPAVVDGTRAGTIRTGLDLSMAAAGLLGVLLPSRETGGVEVAATADAMGVRTRSAAVRGGLDNLAAATAEVTRLRLGLVGSRAFRLGDDGSTLTPSVEIGVRQDGGDAEAGLGADVGAGLTWADPKRGLGAELHGRGVIARESEGLRQRGFAGSFSWDPVTGDRGPRLSLTRTLDVSTQVGTRALPGRMTANDGGNDWQPPRLAARFGYGLPALGDRFTSRPEVAVGLSDAGRDYSLGWRLASGRRADGGVLELTVEARRREWAGDRIPMPEHAVDFRVTARF